MADGSGGFGVPIVPHSRRFRHGFGQTSSRAAGGNTVPTPVAAGASRPSGSIDCNRLQRGWNGQEARSAKSPDGPSVGGEAGKGGLGFGVALGGGLAVPVEGVGEVA